LDRLANLRLAGDYFLWIELARQTDLHTVYSHLASFSFEKGQLTENQEPYRSELESIRPTASWGIRMTACRERSMKRWRWAGLGPILPRIKFGKVFRFDTKNYVWSANPESACP